MHVLRPVGDVNLFKNPALTVSLICGLASFVLAPVKKKPGKPNFHLYTLRLNYGVNYPFTRKVSRNLRFSRLRAFCYLYLVLWVSEAPSRFLYFDPPKNVHALTDSGETLQLRRSGAIRARYINPFSRSRYNLSLFINLCCPKKPFDGIRSFTCTAPMVLGKGKKSKVQLAPLAEMMTRRIIIESRWLKMTQTGKECIKLTLQRDLRDIFTGIEFRDASGRPLKHVCPSAGSSAGNYWYYLYVNGFDRRGSCNIFFYKETEVVECAVAFKAIPFRIEKTESVGTKKTITVPAQEAEEVFQDE